MEHAAAAVNSDNGLSILRQPEVSALTGLGRIALWRKVKDHTFPAPRKLGLRSIGWIRREVEDWILTRPPTVAVEGTEAAENSASAIG